MDSRQTQFVLICLLIAQIAGFTLLWLKIPEPQVMPVLSSAPESFRTIDPASITAAVKLPDEHLLRESIRSLLKQELQDYLQEAKAQTPATTSKHSAMRGKTPDKPSAQVALQSHAIVDRALASGVWTNNDSSALLKIAPRLTESQRIEILEKIFGAINRQELKPLGALPSL